MIFVAACGLGFMLWRSEAGRFLIRSLLVLMIPLVIPFLPLIFFVCRRWFDRPILTFTLAGLVLGGLGLMLWYSEDPWWSLVGDILGGSLVVAGPIIWTLYFPLILLVRWKRFDWPILTCTLAGLVLSGSSIALVGLFLTEPYRFRSQFFVLVSGTVGFLEGIWLYVGNRRHHFFPAAGPSEARRALRLNLRLATLSVLLLGIIWAMPSLKWAGPTSVGLAVAVDREDRLSVDFYGRGVNPGTVGIVLNNRLARGASERIDLFGFQVRRGFVPNASKKGKAPEAIDRIAFHHGEVGDWIIPLLIQFPNLEHLDIRETRISRAGARELQSALPRCKLLQ